MALVLNRLVSGLSCYMSGSLSNSTIIKQSKGFIIPFTNVHRYVSNSASNASTKTKEHYDVVIAGGGMVGLATGCALGNSVEFQTRRILILEKNCQKAWSLPEEFSNRVSSINNCSKDFFKGLEVWERIEAYRVQPVRRLQVWESNSEAMIIFDENDVKEMVAHIVENDVIINALKLKLPENVEVIYGAKIRDFILPTSNNTLVEVIFEDGKCITTEMLVGADGVGSDVRKAMDSHYISWDYEQMGVVGTLQLFEEQDNYVAWQKFVLTGPIALLPLSSKYSSLVWSTSKAEAKQLLTLSDENFIDALNNAIWNDEPPDPLVKDFHERWRSLLSTFGPGPGAAEVKMLPPSFSAIVPKSRAAFPLGLGHASHYVAPRVALVGDAAHRVHPLAGQGVNLGFGDVAKLVSTLENSIHLGLDLGDESELHHYETSRLRHNVPMMGAIDLLQKLYSLQSTPLVLLRSLGLSATNVIMPLKLYSQKADVSRNLQRRPYFPVSWGLAKMLDTVADEANYKICRELRI